MRPQAHLAASLAIWAASPAPLWEAPACALWGNLPDLDRSVAKALGVERRDHHRWVSHSFAGWAPTLLLLRRGPAARRATACLWTHLLLDTYADGIAWLWPLHRDKIGLFRGPPARFDAGWRTPAPLSSRTGRLELVLWAAAAVGLSCRRWVSRG